MDLLRSVAACNGFFTRAQARELGYHDRAVAQCMAAREWTRIRRGYYVFTDEWTALTPEQKHRVRARAVMHSLGEAVALTGVSGLVEHGVAMYGLPLDRVHVVRLDGGAGRAEGDVVHHEGLCLDSDLIEVDGVLVVKPTRCTIEACSRATPESALVSFDSLLYLGLATPEELRAQHKLMSKWPFTQRLHVPVWMADGRAQSAGESRGRWLFRSAGVPAPELQFEVRDATGALIGTCDWGWPGQGLLGEFDGRVKYGRLLKPGQDVADVVFAEKQREDALREVTQFSMIRLVWSDLDKPVVTRARIERLLRRAG